MREHIYFQKGDKPKGRKTDIVEIRSKHNDSLLGLIKWWGPWRQYTFQPEQQTVFNNDCMKQIINKVIDMNKKHRDKINRPK